MHRREVLKSAAAIVGVPASMTVLGDHQAQAVPEVLLGNKLTKAQENELAEASRFRQAPPAFTEECELTVPYVRPLIIIRVTRRLSDQQRQQIEARLHAEGERCNCIFTLIDDAASVTVVGEHAHRYGFTEKIGEHSLSVFCQTADELREWLPPNKH